MSSNSDSNEMREAPKRKLAPPRWRLTRRHMLAALAVLLTFDVVFYLFAVRPLGAREEEQRILLRTLLRQQQQKTEELERLRVVVAKVEKARVEGDELINQLTLARNNTYSRLLAELDAAADEAGLESRERAYDPDPIEGAEEYGAITVTASFRGRYEQLVNLLHRLDHSEEFLIIGALGATPRSDTNDLQITMRIDTFVRDL